MSSTNHAETTSAWYKLFKPALQCHWYCHNSSCRTTLFPINALTADILTEWDLISHCKSAKTITRAGAWFSATWALWLLERGPSSRAHLKSLDYLSQPRARWFNEITLFLWLFIQRCSMQPLGPLVFYKLSKVLFIEPLHSLLLPRSDQQCQIHLT